MAGIGIIANPYSKQNRTNPQHTKLLSYIAGEKGHMAITENLKELTLAAQSFLDKKIDILAINGGDGTICQTLSSLVQVYKDKPLPKIALLGGGTMNMLADNIGLKGHPQERLAHLIQAHARDSHFSTKRFGTLKIKEHIGFLFASGTSALFLKEFYKNKTGSLGVLLLVGRICLDLLWYKKIPHPIVKSDFSRISIDHRPFFSVENLSVLFSTVAKLPMGIPFFLDLQNQRQALAQLSIITLRAEDIILKLPILIWNRRRQKHSWELKACCHHLKIKNEGVLDYTIDGELFQAPDGTVDIEKGPELEFIENL